MTEHRRSGITRQIIEVLEDNRDRALTIERIANLVDYNVKNTTSLISQLRKNRPNLVIESPTTGVFIYRGTRSVDAVIAAETEPEVKPATKPQVTPRRAGRVINGVVTPLVGDLVEVIGFGQDGTPLARDTGGKLYLLQPL